MIQNMCTTNRLILKKILKYDIKNFQNVGLCRIGASSRNYSKCYNTVPLIHKILKPQEYEKYKSQLSYVVEHLATVEKELPLEINQHVRNMLNYTLPGHVQDTGPMVVTAYKHFAHPEKQTPENIDLAYTMAWVHNMVMRCIQIGDDILDESETRNNKLCWHKVQNIGLNAINDCLIMGESVPMVIKNYLLGHPSYIPILELTNELKFEALLGQVLDCDYNFEHLNMEKWKILAKYKGTIPYITDPIVRGMYMAEVFDKSIRFEMTTFFEELGEYFIAQNDMLDCYGDPAASGKYGTDILTGKRTWLAAQALADANISQRELFQKHYRRVDEDSQKLIYDVYSDLNILEKFLIYEERSYKKLCRMIEKMPATIPKECLYQIVDAFYGKL